MAVDRFNMRKMGVLKKVDKSSVGGWDARIKKLCDGINKRNNYYTTSSCSGRVLFMVDQDKKGEGLFLRVYHDAVNFSEVKDDLIELIELSRKRKIAVKFKQEPAILHVACRDLQSAFKLYQFAQSSGWKRNGLIAWNKNIVLELSNTEKLEFPVINNGKVLVSNEFLGFCIEKSNKNLERNWEKIEKLRKFVKSL